MSAEKDRPWVMRTYAGHSTAAASNELYRKNLAKGQTGLSVAFDLPTQTGYDPDSPLSRGEVGKVGVPVPHLGEMRKLFDQIPLVEMNTSMTINATAMWLLALYQVAAEEQNPGVDPSEVAQLLAGTTQNDIIKEYLSRGTYVFPPQHSLRLTADTIAYTVNNIPKWNPINICSYHLQEAGATPTQELAYALCTAIAVLDQVKASGQVSDDDFEKVVGRISFFVNAGVRFVEETCKMRAFTRMWDQITSERYGVQDPKMRRFRYGVQVNSLGLTEAQPENNVQRIVLEMLGVTLSKNARARAVQLPAWNEALGLPRPWDQQWSLRLQQVLAFESDLLEYDDIFEGSTVIEAKVAELIASAQEEMDRVQALGGAIAAVESGYMKSELVSSHARRRARIESGRRSSSASTSSRPPRSPRSRRTSTAPSRPLTRLPSRLRSPVSRSGRPNATSRRSPRRSPPWLLQPRPPTTSSRRPSSPPARGPPRVSGQARCARCSGSSVRPLASPGLSSRRLVLNSARCASVSGRPARSWAADCDCWSASPASTATPTVPSRLRCALGTPASRSSTRASA